MTERIIPILRKEYREATEALQYLDKKSELTSDDPEVIRRRAFQNGRHEAVSSIVTDLNEEFGTNYRRDATRNPSRKKKRSKK